MFVFHFQEKQQNQIKKTVHEKTTDLIGEFKTLLSQPEPITAKDLPKTSDNLDTFKTLIDIKQKQLNDMNLQIKT